MLHLGAYRWRDKAYTYADWLSVLTRHHISFVFTVESCEMCSSSYVLSCYTRVQVSFRSKMRRLIIDGANLSLLSQSELDVMSRLQTLCSVTQKFRVL
jgi:tRNA(Arg) A34 adenosine deaminase TadA